MKFQFKSALSILIILTLTTSTTLSMDRDLDGKVADVSTASQGNGLTSVSENVAAPQLSSETELLVMASWKEGAQYCRQNIALFMDYIQNYVSLTASALQHLNETQTLGPYAPLVGRHVDDCLLKMQPLNVERYRTLLTSNVETHTLMRDSYATLWKHLSYNPVNVGSTDSVPVNLFEHVLVTTTQRLESLHIRHSKNKETLTRMTDGPIATTLVDVICIGRYREKLPQEALVLWELEEKHIKMQWWIIKELYGFLATWEKQYSVSNLLKVHSAWPKYGRYIFELENTPYLTGQKEEPDLVANTLNTDENRAKMERVVFARLRRDYETLKQSRDHLQKVHLKNLAKKEQVTPHSWEEDPRSLDDLMEALGENDRPETDSKKVAAQPKKGPQKQKKAPVVFVSQPALETQENHAKKQLEKLKKKASLGGLAAELSSSSLPDVEVKTAPTTLTPDRQHRQDARAERRQANEANLHKHDVKRDKAKAATLKSVSKTRTERAADHLRRVEEVGHYKTVVALDLYRNLPPIDQNIATFFHLFYTCSDPIDWTKFCTNFERLDGVIINYPGSKRKLSWTDPNVTGATFSKEVHAPHPCPLLGNHYRLHIARFLNVLPAFQHQRMINFLGLTDTRVYDRTTFEADLLNFWDDKT